MTAVARTVEADERVAAPVRAWDGAIRLFHWMLAALIVSAYLTRYASNDPMLYLHRLNGYSILTLLLFRLFWGFSGSSTARLAAFFPRPEPVVRYGRALFSGRPMHYLGHNPVGSLLIFALLLAVAVQAIAALFTTDDALDAGPLYRHAPEAIASLAGKTHARRFWFILAPATLHIAANLVYQFVWKDRLITSMVSGRKPPRDDVDEPQALIAPASLALACLLVAAAIVAGGVMLAGDSLLR